MQKFILLLALIALVTACQDKQSTAASTPVHSDFYDLDAIQQSGEIIVLILYGPDTYYDYRGTGMGYQYQVSQLFGQHIGARVRVEVANQPQELLQMLQQGEGDLIACTLPDSLLSQTPLVWCGDSLSQWAVRPNSPMLAEALNNWMQQSGKLRYDAKYRVIEKKRQGRTRIHAQAPIKNLAAGIISDYDNLFKYHARTLRWDWRLLAAQAYQESAFDAQAESWVGAQGLMQLMPGTARDMGVNQLFNPAENLQGAVKYLQLLNRQFSDIADGEERIKFMLAAYNCGPLHVQDAQALARKYGHDPHRWTGHVDQYVRALSQVRYYRDPVVKYGYCRGSEPYNYVLQIEDRYRQYKQKIR